MPVLQLSKENTYKLVLYSRKLSFNRKRFSFTTKTVELCLGCKTPIYFSFTQSSVSAAFCQDCQGRVNAKSMVQSQYVRVIKERQLQLIEGATQHMMDDIRSYSENKTQ